MRINDATLISSVDSVLIGMVFAYGLQLAKNVQLIDDSSDKTLTFSCGGWKVGLYSVILFIEQSLVIHPYNSPVLYGYWALLSLYFRDLVSPLLFLSLVFSLTRPMSRFGVRTKVNATICIPTSLRSPSLALYYYETFPVRFLTLQTSLAAFWPWCAQDSSHYKMISDHHPHFSPPLQLTPIMVAEFHDMCFWDSMQVKSS